ncbi:MAG TPA: aldo/keto reductase [Polyangiaceae bacterium]|jgi:aryl-alcohol dehydrogenase-like predicted oxidoreductase|nr:aldo/keto reductase [Polyangiaceae bacterium]
MERRRLGRSGLVVSCVGAGTNRWGAHDVERDDVVETYRALRTAGVDFFDTAELYNKGESEKLVGELTKNETVIVATKFAPLPHRITESQFDRALDASLARLGRRIDLYYLHFPYSFVSVRTWMERLARAHREKKIGAIGVSNCSAKQMRVAAKVLDEHGIALAANQVHYSVLHTAPETNGVLDACRELDVALVAYRPLAGGAVGDPKSALHALLDKDEHVIVIPGTTSAAHAATLAASFRG